MAESEDTAAGSLRSEPGFAVSLLAAALPGLYLLITSTTTLVTSIFPYDFKRILEFALLLALFLLPAFSRRIREELETLLASAPRWIGFTLLGIVAWGVLSATVNARSAMHLANSLSEVALLSSLVLGVFVVAACRHISRSWFDRIAIGLLALTGLTVGAQELLGVAAAHAGGVDFNFRISLLHFSWPRFYNQVQSWSVPVIVALPLLFSKYSLARLLCVLVLGLHWYILLMTGARGSIVALSAAFTFALVFLPPVRKPLLQWQLSGILLGALIYGGVLLSFEAPSAAGGKPLAAEQPGQQAESQPKDGFYSNEDEDTSSFLAQSLGRPLLDPMGRNWIWRLTLQDAAAHPVLGIGPMNYACTSPALFGHPHNFALQLAAEWGIPAALALGLLLAALLWKCTLHLRRTGIAASKEGVLSGLLLTGALAAAFHSCVSGVMVMPASQVTGLLVCGMLLGLAPVRMHAGAVLAGRFAFLSGMVLAAALLVLGAQELSTMAERSPLLRPGLDLQPRIWQDSKVCQLYLPQNEVNN